ncbi:TlpA family protein disulfide reductase [Paenibacillus tepidiphilus]|uniref:TlpA family protein disulfide reductase n=1 Tax=Paenibacillus tepidiphilus TaxID=2608683 RepID=UPI001EEFE44A|nr:TlpA disulfide reductase family protein [Paenibacillus tepidiphilus]
MTAVNRCNRIISVLLITLAVLAPLEPAQAAPAPVSHASAAAGAGPGRLAPAFTLQDAGGTSRQVGGPREKALLLNFWASWCGPCQLEAPDLNRLAVKYKDVLDVYGVNVTSQDVKQNAERFVRKYMLSFPVLYDLKGQVFARYNGQVFPTNVLVAKDGVISEVILGVLPPEELERKIAALTSR